jgi:hypothetical protein
MAAALTDRSKYGSREDSTRICGENNLTRVPTRNHSRGEGSGDINQQNANYWQANIMNVRLRKEVPEEILYNLNYTWSNRIWSTTPFGKDLIVSHWCYDVDLINYQLWFIAIYSKVNLLTGLKFDSKELILLLRSFITQ